MTTRATSQRRSVIAVALAAVTVSVAATASLLEVTRGGNDEQSPPPILSSASAVPTVTNSRQEHTPPERYQFDYQPLWPYASAAAAQRALREGHQPWRLDAGTVAQMFTRDYLGFPDVDKVVDVVTQGEHARVSVGFDHPNGAAATAAVVHLVRFGVGDDAPWEVVGTDDSTLTLTGPSYGSTVRSPLLAGGRISGVDESLRVQVRQIGHPRPVGEAPPTPAGGTDTPWTATVPFTAPCPGTLTVVVSTGGHVAEVERFAITGVHC
ncbi:hypothetical protein [Nocardia amamiensis]|uniref:hypothetical protein n=1 Tax=Nocardia amamiensis TaxID=404578 RepID=UPI0033F648FF